MRDDRFQHSTRSLIIIFLICSIFACDDNIRRNNSFTKPGGFQENIDIGWRHGDYDSAISIDGRRF